MSEEKQYKVLILEDSVDDAELLERRLRKTKLNLDLKHITNKTEYLESLAKFGPDLIVSDYKLPQFDGLSALSLARKIKPSIPFILVSGYIDDEFAAKTVKAGVTDYLLKDRLERLGVAVENALRGIDHRRLEEEYHNRMRQLEIENEEMRERESRIMQLRRELEALRNELSKVE